MSYTPPSQPLNVTWEGTSPYTAPGLPLVATWAVAGANEGTFAVTIPAPTPPAHAPTLAASLDNIQTATGAISLPAPVTGNLPPITVAATMTLDLAMVQDVDGPRVGERSQHLTGKAASRHGGGWHEAIRVRTPGHQPHQHGAHITRRCSYPSTEMLRIRRASENQHQHGLKLQRGMAATATEAHRVRFPTRTDHQHGIPIRNGTGFGWADTVKLRNRSRHDHAEALFRADPLQAATHEAIRTQTPLGQAWTHATHPEPGRWWPFYVPPGLHLVIPCDGDYVPRPLHCTVLLHWEPIEQPYCPGLDPEPPIDGPLIIPIREVYIVINTFALARADTAEPVPAAEFTATLDVDSWTWGWSARLPADQLALVRSPDPGEYVELVATLNGTPIRLAVERLGRDRRFGEAWLRISGRGRAAILGDPHSPVITRANEAQLTARQLLEAALTDNGVPIGWTVDWQTPNWSVPAGVWAHQGTYIDAALRLAEAAGGYVQAHDTAQTLHILPRYPILPWNWGAATPDIVLPEDVCEIEGIEWLDRPRYNAVWISGAESGRRDRIRRTGSAADRYAPSIVDPLATHEDMTRARGSAILADTGRQAHISVRLPVLPETGIIKPGQLIEYTEGGNTHRGLSRSVSLEHRFPQLWQTVKIETHQEATP